MIVPHIKLPFRYHTMSFKVGEKILLTSLKHHHLLLNVNFNFAKSGNQTIKVIALCCQSRPVNAPLT